MPTLVFRSSDGTEQSFELTGELTVGREVGNDVVLKDQGVSRKHCRFYLSEDGQAVVEDLGSANGVSVNGEKIAEPVIIDEQSQVIVGGSEVSLVAKKAPRKPVSSRPSGARPPASKSVALAVRDEPAPAPSAGPKRTRMMSPSEAPKSRPQPAQGKSTGAEARPRLKGLTGPWAGKYFDLNKPRLVVGRVAPADIVIEDDSVSRRHAEFIKAGAQVSVRDLGSANGTFLNGDQISEAPLSPGDTLRFGVIELTYSGPKAAKAAATPANKKKLLMIVGGAILVLLVAMVALAPKPQPPGEGGGGGGGEGGGPSKPRAEDPNKLMGQCRAFSDPDMTEVNWTRAVEICGKVVDLDPTITEARKLLSLSKKELTCEKQIAEAQLKASTAQDDAAIKVLLQVDKSCSSFLRARKIFSESAGRLAKRRRTDCKTDFAAGLYSSAVEKCQAHMDVTCQINETDDEVVRLFNQAARMSGKSNGFKCPPEYHDLQVLIDLHVEDDSVAAQKAIRLKYKDAPIAEGMIRYYADGRAKQISDEFKRLRIKQPKLRNQLDDIVLKLDIIEGRFASGQEGIRRNNPSETETFWKEAIEAEQSLMPPGIISPLVKNMKTQLAEAFYVQSENEIKKEHMREAWAVLKKGFDYDPQNQKILLYIQKMDNFAKHTLADGGCDNAQLAFDVTLAKTDKRAASPTHAAAQEYLEEHHCR